MISQQMNDQLCFRSRAAVEQAILFTLSVSTFAII